MHISEGVLSPAVLGAGAALAVAGLAMGLRKLDYDRLMTVAILAATFFVGSLIHVPIGPSSAHLILNGLVGILLGWAAFPAIFVPLLTRSPALRAAAGFACGALAVAGAGFLTAVSLGLSSEGFASAAKIIFMAHIPVMIAEGVITALTLSFIARVRPEMLEFSR